MKRGSPVVYCPRCGTPHLVDDALITRERGIIYMVCQFCSKLPWRARL